MSTKGKATVIVGLPGSGKTTYAKEHYRGVRLFDDISVSGDLPLLEAALDQGEHCIVVETLACLEGTRITLTNWMKARGFTIEWEFFENNPQQCLENVKARKAQGDLRKVEKFIEYTTRDYHIPEDVEPLPVYRQP